MSKYYVLLVGLLIASMPVVAQQSRIKRSRSTGVHISQRNLVALGSGPALVESTDFPPVSSDSSPDHPGDGCFWLASGTIVAGDVDAISVTLPFATTSVILDVDFEDGAGSSMLLALLGDVSSVLGTSDGNNADDAVCGLGATSDPIGSAQDSVAKFSDTLAGSVVEIRVTGSGDFGFEGAHDESFSYDIWVHAIGEPTGCTTNDECDDRVFCNGAEVCDATGECVGGDVPDCSDQTDCTVDRCDFSTDACVSVPDDAECDDGAFCNGAEVCDAANGCMAGDEPDCDDQIDCTVDSCDFDSDACVSMPDDAECDDDVFCNGAEVCDAANGCMAGDEPDCDDGIECTTDRCDVDTDACVNEPDDAMCIGLFLDIMPGSCKNRLNLRKHGVVPVALLSTGDSISETIDVSTLRLGRKDGIGTGVAPRQGSRGPQTQLRDAGAPSPEGTCACHSDTGDGVLDLVMKFDMSELVSQLQLSVDTLPDPLELELTGMFQDGSVFAVSDCFELVPGKTTRGNKP